MKYILIAVSLFLVGCTQLSTRDIVDNNKNGIVLITNKIDASTGGIGTGFIIEDNVIVTNEHVIGGGGILQVQLPSSPKRYDATVVYEDKIADIAVIKVNDWEKFNTEQSPVKLKFGDSEKLSAGDKIVVVGHPWGLHWTVSEGIMSSKDRKTDTRPKYLDQIDAKLFQGNSGGPVFNEDGEIICVSNMMLSNEGGSYGFCIPSVLVKKVLNDFNAFKEVRWRSLNAQIGPDDTGDGVYIKVLESGGAAESAGLKVDDRILKIFTSLNKDGLKVNSSDQLTIELATLDGSEEMIKLLVDRAGQEVLVDVKTNYRTAKDFT
jgi:serine protease Do